MSAQPTISTEIAAHLSQLVALCDTGFALAVHIRFTSPTLLYRTYAPAWIEYYSERGFMMQDPVVRRGLMQAGTVLWDDLADEDPAGVISAAAAHGLINGWNYAVGPATSRTLCGFTRSGPAFTAAQMDQGRTIVDSIHALTEGIEHFPPAHLVALRALVPS